MYGQVIKKAKILMFLIVLFLLISAEASFAAVYSGGIEIGPGNIANDSSPYITNYSIQGLSPSADYYLKLRLNAISTTNYYGQTYNSLTDTWLSQTATWVNHPIVSADINGNINGWIAGRVSGIASGQYKLQVVLRKAGSAITDTTQKEAMVNSIDISSAGNGGWIEGYAYKDNSLLLENSIIQVKNLSGEIAGMYLSENNGISEGYNANSGYFKVGAPLGEYYVEARDINNNSLIAASNKLVTVNSGTTASINLQPIGVLYADVSSPVSGSIFQTEIEENVNIDYSINNGNALYGVFFFYSADNGISFQSINEGVIYRYYDGDSSFLWNLPLIKANNVYLKLTVIDRYGQISEKIISNLTITDKIADPEEPPEDNNSNDDLYIKEASAIDDVTVLITFSKIISSDDFKPEYFKIDGKYPISVVLDDDLETVILKLSDNDSLESNQSPLVEYNSLNSNQNLSIFAIDRIAPDKPTCIKMLNSSGSYINKSTASRVNIKGNAEKKSTVKIIAIRGIQSASTSLTTSIYGEFRGYIDLSGLKDGNIAIKATATDVNGNSSLDSNPIIVYKDTNPPKGRKILINAGALYTDKRLISLILSASGINGDGLVGLSENNNLKTAKWAKYAKQKQFKITSAGKGMKKVFAWFMDKAGNISLPISDTITLR